MPTIIANIVNVEIRGHKFQFTSEIKLPEFPKVGEVVWLKVGRRFGKFRTVKRWEIAQSEDFIEYDFRRCFFSNNAFSAYALGPAIEDDSRWRPFHRNGYKKFIEEETPVPV